MKPPPSRVFLVGFARMRSLRSYASNDTCKQVTKYRILITLSKSNGQPPITSWRVALHGLTEDDQEARN